MKFQHKQATSGFLKGGTAYPFGVRDTGGFGRGYGADPQKDADFSCLVSKTRPPKSFCSWDIPASKFRCCCRAQFPNLAKFEVIVPFVTTYRCEQSFSLVII